MRSRLGLNGTIAVRRRARAPPLGKIEDNVNMTSEKPES
jgi:hypothetical protein